MKFIEINQNKILYFAEKIIIGKMFSPKTFCTVSIYILN